MNLVSRLCSVCCAADSTNVPLNPSRFCCSRTFLKTHSHQPSPCLVTIPETGSGMIRQQLVHSAYLLGILRLWLWGFRLASCVFTGHFVADDSGGIFHTVLVVSSAAAATQHQGSNKKDKWVVVKTMVPFWIPIIIRHLIFRVPQTGTIIFGQPPKWSLPRKLLAFAPSAPSRH